MERRKMKGICNVAWETLSKFILKSPLEGEREYLDEQFERYIETIKLLPTSNKRLKVLDIGAAYGHMTILIKELIGYEVSCIDIERDITVYWRKRLIEEGVDSRPCDLTKDPIPFNDKTFDIILLCEVLEHLPIHPRYVFKEVNRVLKTRGILIASTPNLLSFLNLARALLFGGKSTGYPRAGISDYILLKS